MASTKQQRMVTVLVWLVLALFLTSIPVGAQDEPTTGDDELPEAAQTSGTPGIIFISATDSSGVPTVGLRVVGLNGDGSVLDPSVHAVTIRHNGEIVVTDETRPEQVGTLTVFLIDLTSGVEAQTPAVQALIEQFAGEPYMAEQVDHVAIYRAAEDSAVQMLEPTPFHNSVQNFFVNPPEVQGGPTALVDSLSSLLEQIDSLKPDPAMMASIVVISDGTDALSTGDPDDVAPRAAELGIPLHTVGLTNSNLSVDLQSTGHAYLADLADASRGSYADIDDGTALDSALTRFAALRDHWWLFYTVPDATGGTFPVEVSLLHEPEVKAETSITVSGTTPSVILDIPQESRELSLPDLEEPVVLGFSSSVTWLDGTQRQVETAELFVNGQSVASINPEDLAGFESEINNLTFGQNSVQLAISDEQGLEARSPEIILNISQGAQQIPPELAPGTPWFQYVGYCLVGLLVLAVVAGAAFFVLNRLGLLSREPRRRSRPIEESPAQAARMDVQKAPAPMSPPPMAPVPDAVSAPGASSATLEVLQSESRMPPQLSLSGSQTRLGRSPEQSDIAFEQDITVSRLHATITWDGEMYHIYDENSTSGTWVNDQQVIDYGLQLLDGDELYLGKVVLRFNLPA